MGEIDECFICDSAHTYHCLKQEIIIVCILPFVLKSPIPHSCIRVHKCWNVCKEWLNSYTAFLQILFNVTTPMLFIAWQIIFWALIALEAINHLNIKVCISIIQWKCCILNTAKQISYSVLSVYLSHCTCHLLTSNSYDWAMHGLYICMNESKV